MDYVAEFLKIKPVEVFEVASFYSMFNLKPVGKCTFEVCRTSSCWLCGAEDIVKYIEKKLNIKDGETTKDGMFTLKTVECLGSCSCFFKEAIVAGSRVGIDDPVSAGTPPAIMSVTRSYE